MSRVAAKQRSQKGTSLFKFKSIRIPRFKFKPLTIARKLPLALLISALLVSAGVGIGSYVIGSQAVVNLTQRNLATLASERGSQLNVFIKGIETDLVATSRTETTIQALRDFASGWVAIKDDKTAALQQSYIGNNPNPDGKRALLDTDGTNSTYNTAHARFQPAFRMQMETHGYSDLYLFDTAGNSRYTRQQARRLRHQFHRQIQFPGQERAGEGLLP